MVYDRSKRRRGTDGGPLAASNGAGPEVVLYVGGDAAVPRDLEAELDGAEVRTAPSVDAAMEALASETVGCVVGELGRADVAGLVEAVREHHPHLPFVLVAADCWENVATDGATLETAADVELRADPDKLRHVFENLFRNAVEHGFGGSDTVTVTVGRTANGFYVADDGPGIQPQERERVFEQGYSDGDGTGSGLAIVETIARAHGWSVTVTESRAGGARFEFDVDGQETRGPPSRG